MKNGSGRRARKRRKKRTETQNATLSHQEHFVDLRRWLKERGFNSQSLIPTSFSDTGRGLMTTQSVKADDILISLPEKCLLTTSTVLKSYMGEYIRRWKPPVSPLLALCSFLIAERHFGDVAEWSPYIKVLPASYTCPVYFSDDLLDLLPRDLRKKASEQKARVQELYFSSQPFFSSLQPLFPRPVEDVFTHDALRWAWCSVNTRSVYMEHAQSDFLSREKDNYALAPYLDLLNHCPHVQVEAGFNKGSRCYEIRSVQGCRKFQQAFICYGPHDNQRLLLEYGFVAPGNQNGVVYADPRTLTLSLHKEDKQLPQKLIFLEDNGFLRDLTFGVDGPSWQLMTALKLLSLKPEQYCSWKSVLLGAAVSQESEEWSVHKAQTLCQHLSDDTTDALKKLAELKDCADQAGVEQLGVVESLRREELLILQRSRDVLQNLLPRPSPWQQNSIQNMGH
ncbi:SET domain-containing protein 4 isoform X2 [Brachyhypopomus gauderio]|uniref:SET domain-containing protein 4 isoform X2 n=1 Tax=Brachyhypopomus gauderio TaxID=698409 RepID=UPI004042B9F6